MPPHPEAPPSVRPPLTIVPATPAHAAALAVLHEACFAGQPWHRPWRTTEMGQVLALPGAMGWIALAPPDPGATVSDGIATDHPVGMLLVQTSGLDADILTLGVRPDRWRRRGIARTVLAHGEDVLRRHGVERIFLEVALDNRAAVAFYTNAGYNVLGRRSGYYSTISGETFDAATMGRTLV
ncbi:GNAT family N-acetyltransferase [Roseospira marina]|nr:GNAT family N-acetyltransferase [Roseospira marina]MBB4314629.1 ribosomal-protein-alanine N-acetyltransferase [Roseospira marina]MBB5088766.1 ribosomal-protein-alanine N-acetyltransferase [Roseospira marina]